MFGGILKVVTSAVTNIIGGLGKQQNIIQELIQTPIQGMIGQVTGDGIWTGSGADAFVEELNSIFLPDTQNIQDTIKSMSDSISSARDLIEEADKKAASSVGDLIDIFDNIF